MTEKERQKTEEASLKGPDMAQRQDPLAPYLKEEASRFVFDVLSQDYLASSGLDFMAEVPIPLTLEDLTAFQEGGLPLVQLADNMTLLLGLDPAFPSAGAYLRFLAFHFDEKLVDVLIGQGGRQLEEACYIPSAAYFRAALLLDPRSARALFGYACACREWYLSLDASLVPQQISDLKEESRTFFETCIRLHPDFSAAYYFLGYAYWNAGLYKKAQLVWQRFLDQTGEGPEREEILERLEELEDPVAIEEGVNALLTGRTEEGLAALEAYVDTEYGRWWPLHYYLGSAYRLLGHRREAIEGFLKVLDLAPSHQESALQLAELYEEEGDSQAADKYRRKVEIFRQNREEELH